MDANKPQRTSKAAAHVERKQYLREQTRAARSSAPAGSSQTPAQQAAGVSAGSASLSCAVPPEVPGSLPAVLTPGAVYLPALPARGLPSAVRTQVMRQRKNALKRLRRQSASQPYVITTGEPAGISRITSRRSTTADLPSPVVHKMPLPPPVPVPNVRNSDVVNSGIVVPNVPVPGTSKASNVPVAPRKDAEEFNFEDYYARFGLRIRRCLGDGNCMFRAFSDQMEGDEINHFHYRTEVVQYIVANVEDFAIFHEQEEEKNFDLRMKNLARPYKDAGQESLVAFARFFNRYLFLHQPNVGPPIHFPPFDGANFLDFGQVHVLYTGGNHYQSIRFEGDHVRVPATVRFLGTVAAGQNPYVRVNEQVENVPTAHDTRHRVSPTQPRSSPIVREWSVQSEEIPTPPRRQHNPSSSSSTQYSSFRRSPTPVYVPRSPASTPSPTHPQFNPGFVRRTKSRPPKLPDVRKSQSVVADLSANALRLAKRRIAETTPDYISRIKQQRERQRHLRSANAALSSDDADDGLLTQQDLRNIARRGLDFDESDVPSDVPSEQTIRNGIGRFRAKMSQLSFYSCSTCNESFADIQLRGGSTECGRCKGDKHGSNIKKFSAENGMDPGAIVPDELQGLTQVEEMLIAQVAAIVQVRQLKGGQRGYSGNVINFPQDVQGFVTTLPRRLQDVNVIIVRRAGENAELHRDFHVRRDRVWRALRWLKANNPYYADIVIDQDNLAALPEDGDVSLLLPSMLIEAPANADVVEGCPPGDDEDISLLEEEQINTFAMPQAPRLTDQVTIDNYIRNLDNVHAMWPKISNNPINEFETLGYMSCAFPTLIPEGACDLRSPHPRKVNPAEFFKHLLRYRDGRFAKHPRFPFFALNSELRWRALTQGSLFLKYRRNNDVNMTMAEFKQKYENDPDGISSSIVHFGSTLRASRQYWYKRRSELTDQIEQLGCPTVFFTFSAADLYWPELHDLCSGGRLQPEMTVEQRRKWARKNLIDNPLIAAWFLHYRFKTFMEEVLRKAFRVVDDWHRFEWQHRGSGHVHGFLWLKDAPDIKNMETKTEEERKAIADYFDGIVTTWSVNQDAVNPEDHPCQLRAGQLRDDDEDFAALQNMVQRHTRCTAGYCLVMDKRTKKQACRFHYPKELRDMSALVRDDNGTWQFLSRRNDPLLNGHNRVQLQTWRANCDWSPIVDVKALLRYVTKYASKSEQRSQTFGQIFQNLLLQANDDDPPRQAIQRLLIKSVSERDYSAQEVCHLLHSLPLHSSSRTFVKLSLYRDSNLRRIQRTQNSEGEETATGTDIIGNYMNRQDDMEEWTLRLVATQCQWENRDKWWTVMEPSKFHVLSVLPKLPVDPTNEDYCRQRVLLDVPFRNIDDLTTNYGGSWQETFVGLLGGQHGGNILNFDDVEDEEDYFDDLPADVQDDQAGWMALAGLGPAAQRALNDQVDRNMLGKRPIDVGHDWGALEAVYNPERDIVKFVQEEKRHAGGEADDVIQIDPCTLNIEQRRGFDLVIQHNVRRLRGEQISPLRLIVQGTAGTGKSHFTKCVEQSLNANDRNETSKTCMVLAPTGVAASNINGRTLHSALRLPLKLAFLRDLSGESAKTFQKFWSKTWYVIIDERSMVGCRLLCAVDRRMREAKPDSQAELFGGISVIMVGDHYQLPPVLDAPVYRTKNALSSVPEIQNGYMIYRSFEHALVLTIQQRQAGTDAETVKFREMLWRLREGASTMNDWMAFMNRFQGVLSKDEQQQFHNGVHIYTVNEQVDKFNDKFLSDLGVPVARIDAVHTGPKAHLASYDQAGALDVVVFMAVGSRVMLNFNLWTERGLVNGALGSIIGIVYGPDTRPPSLPLAVLVQFDGYTGPSFSPQQEKIVPVIPVKRIWEDKDNKQCSRMQIPLSTAHAITVHKSQGTTLDRAAIDLGPTEFAAGLSFVATSRVRKIKDLCFTAVFDYDRLEKLKRSAAIQERVTEEQRLVRLGLQGIDLFCHQE